MRVLCGFMVSKVSQCESHQKELKKKKSIVDQPFKGDSLKDHLIIVKFGLLLK